MKIAIIGAGTIGLYLGWKLSDRGHQVTIFEKKKRIGNKVCSGLFSERILNFVPQSKKLIENKIKNALIYFPKKTIKIKFSKQFFVMSHYQLDKLLFDLAKKSGAKIILNRNIRFLPKKFDRIIGCDGANSFVRKLLGLPDPNFRLGILGYLAVSKKKKKLTKDMSCVETWPCQNGFIWKIPRKKEIEYGIITNPRLAFKIFKNFLDENDIKLKKVKAKAISQGLVFSSAQPLSASKKRKGAGQITLCGDSAGLTKPWSGGGVIWGLTAAEILLKNFPDFIKYQKKVNKFFSFKIKIAKVAIKIVYLLGFKLPWLLPKKVRIESDFLL